MKGQNGIRNPQFAMMSWHLYFQKFGSFSSQFRLLKLSRNHETSWSVPCGIIIIPREPMRASAKWSKVEMSSYDLDITELISMRFLYGVGVCGGFTSRRPSLVIRNEAEGGGNFCGASRKSTKSATRSCCTDSPTAPCTVGQQTLIYCLLIVELLVPPISR